MLLELVTSSMLCKDPVPPVMRIFILIFMMAHVFVAPLGVVMQTQLVRHKPRDATFYTRY